MTDVNYRAGESEVTLLDRCRDLRRRSTDAEKRLWSVLRDNKLGAKFRRQHQFGPYILDFFCPEHSLAVEADGGQHQEPDVREWDLMRTRLLESKGLRLLRFADREILQETAAVLEAINMALGEPSPQPSPRGRGSEYGPSRTGCTVKERGQ